MVEMLSKVILKTNSNGKKSDNAEDEKVFIAWAATPTYIGYIAPFPV